MPRDFKRNSATSQKAGNHDLDDPPILDPEPPRANANANADADANLSTNQDDGLAPSSGSDGVVLPDQDKQQNTGVLDGISETEHEDDDVDEMPEKVDDGVPVLPKNSPHGHSSISNKTNGTIEPDGALASALYKDGPNIGSRARVQTSTDRRRPAITPSKDALLGRDIFTRADDNPFNDDVPSINESIARLEMGKHQDALDALNCEEAKLKESFRIATQRMAIRRSAADAQLEQQRAKLRAVKHSNPSHRGIPFHKTVDDSTLTKHDDDNLSSRPSKDPEGSLAADVLRSKRLLLTRSDPATKAMARALNDHSVPQKDPSVLELPPSSPRGDDLDNLAIPS